MYFFKYGNKFFNLKPYTTAVQKDLELMVETTDNFTEETLDLVLDMLNLKYQDLTLDEKICLIYKMREISVSEIFSVNEKCFKCGLPQTLDLDIRNIITNRKKNTLDIKDNYKKFFESDIKDYTDLDIDEMDLDEYEKFLQEVQDNICTFNYIRKVKCLKCGEELSINLRNIKLCVSSFSNETLKSIYTTYSDLVYHAHYTKLDVDSMYPYEREIYKGLLLDKMKKEAEIRNKKRLK